MAQENGVVRFFCNLINQRYMMFITRFWSGTAVVLCALLLQSCQSHSVSGIDPDEEKELAVVGPSSASSTHQRTLSKPVAVQPLTPSSTSLAAHVSRSRFSKTPAHEQDRSTAPSSRLLSPSALSTLVTIDNFPTAPYNLPAAIGSRNSHAVPLGKKLGHSSPDGPGVCVSKVGEALREVNGDAAGDSKLLAKQRSTNLAPKGYLANERVRAGESAEPDRAKEAAKDVRLLAVKTLEEVGEKHCVEQQGQRGDPLTILLDVASSKPDKAIQFLDVLLVAAQDNHCRRQALEAFGKVAQASSGMFSECLPFLRAAAKAEDKDVRLLALKTLGEVEWKHYFGDVEPASDLPGDMDDILDSACPFWPEKQVRDTHLLVLIPAAVDEKPFTLNLLKELIASPKNGGYRTQYDQYYHKSSLPVQIGNNSPDRSYWLLMTRDVLPESRNKTYEAQKELVAGHASRAGLRYEPPKVLEAATAILTHHVRDEEWLYSDNPWTYTRCQEVIVDSEEGEEYPAVVGGFESSGLSVVYDRYDDDHHGRGRDALGIAGCRKFF
jgi:hypothetical protein